jgi:hypothetical protein
MKMKRKMARHPGRYFTIEWTSGLWRGDRANIGVLVTCPDLKHVSVMLTPDDGGAEDKRIAAFFGMDDMEPLARAKESARALVDRCREDFFDDPHLDLKTKREFVWARMDDRLAKHSIYGSVNYREGRAIVVGDDPSVDLKVTYDDMVAWPPREQAG